MSPLVGALVVAAGAGAQAVSGIGFSLVCAPFLIALHGPVEGVRLAITLSIVLNVAGVAREHAGVRPRFVLALLVPAALATPVFAAVVRDAPRDALAAAAGLTVVATAVALARGVRAPVAAGPGGAAVAGVVSAGMNVLASIGGPAAALYATNAGWPPSAARPTLQAYFLALNVVALASLGLPHLDPLPLLGLAAGWAAGVALDRHVPEPVARAATLALGAAGGAVAFLDAVL